MASPKDIYATREDLRQAAGRSIICGFDGTTVTPELKEILREVNPLGLILFARNIESPEQVRELNRELKSLRKDDPLLLSVDQEGGRVARIKAPATEWPTMKALGETADPDLCRRFGKALGAQVRAMDFDINYAPVLDVNTRADNPVIGDRALGDDPATVCALAPAFVQGLYQGGVAACGKHFPGHGDTDKDSHFDLPYVEHDLPRLRAIEWPPFKTAIQAGLDAIMSAHVMVPALDETHPGTLSANVLGHLRTELGFSGMIVSDDIEMKALADGYSPGEMAELGLNAGIDIFLACHKPETTLGLYRGIVQAAEQKKVRHQTLMDNHRRICAWRDRYYREPSASDEAFQQAVAGSEHDLLLAEIEDARQRRLNS